jgi:hypothetical protein
VLHIMSYETQSIEAIQTLTQSHEASDYLQAGLSSRRTMVVALPRSRSRRILEVVDVAMLVQTDVDQLLPIST